MTFLIAAAGTGGHVFPGLAVGEALLEEGVTRDQIVYVGGNRLESTVYPEHGFGFVEVELAGLRRTVTLANLRIPLVVSRARRAIGTVIDERQVRVALGMGGYVTIPTALAARRRGVLFFNAEQNAVAGLANRVAARWAKTSFVSFPETKGLPAGTWVGNPVRRQFWEFDRESHRREAREAYGLRAGGPVIGIFGGSLGALPLNEACAGMLREWSGPEISVVHLVGEAHLEAMSRLPAAAGVTWRRLGFEPAMARFFAAIDLVVSRAGGSVAEITSTATPSVLVPGQFGSGGHQEGNARFLAGVGAAEILDQAELHRLGHVVSGLLDDPGRLAAMSASARAIAKPQAALTIARTMIEAAA